MFSISSRDKIRVEHDGWTMDVFSNGLYHIYKGNRKITSGKYDAMIMDSYWDQMSEDDAKENLTRDLISWIKKAVEGKVVD